MRRVGKHFGMRLLAFALTMVLGGMGGIWTTRMSTVHAAENNVDFGAAVYSSDHSTFHFPNAALTLGTENPQLLVVTVSSGSVAAPADVSGATTFTDKEQDGKRKSLTLIWESAQELSTLQEILRNVTFTYEAGMTVTVTVDANETNLISKLNEGVKAADDINLSEVTLTQWNENGHFYLYVPYFTLNTKCVTWVEAYNKSLSYTLGGRQGYLTTLTEKGEQAYLKNLASNSVWVGGTSLLYKDNSKIAGTQIGGVSELKHPDDYVTKANTWAAERKNSSDNTGNPIIPYYYWACGPEMGEQLETTINKGTEYIVLHYASGAAPELNAYSGGTDGLAREACTASYVGMTSYNGLNDIPNSNLVKNNNAAAKGYLVEFGGWDAEGHDNVVSAKTVTRTYTPSEPVDAGATYVSRNFGWYTDETCETKASNETASGEHVIYLKAASGYSFTTAPTVTLSVSSGTGNAGEVVVAETATAGVYKVTYTVPENTYVTLTSTDPTSVAPTEEGGGSNDGGSDGSGSNGGESNDSGLNDSSSNDGGSEGIFAATSGTATAQPAAVILSPKTGEEFCFGYVISGFLLVGVALLLGLFLRDALFWHIIK